MVLSFWIVISLLILGLSMPAAFRDKSKNRFFIAMINSTFGILLPIFIFLISAFLIPDWKGACKYGWIDCFYVGKLALSPLVLWACAAFYMLKIFKTESYLKAWIVLGIFSGSIVSSLCFVYGIFMLQGFSDMVWLELIVPLYVAIWYTILSVRLIKKSNLTVKAYIFTFISSIPLWVGSVIWSKKEYLDLADSPPSCFVVSSALKGHNAVVRPFFEINKYGVERIVNKQLLIFWKFEEIWSKRFPKSHQFFRRVYNKLGPMIARRVKTQLIADLIYLLIKPFEIIAAIIVAINRKLD